jgi:Flp pilus assembly protein TadD
MGQLPVDCELEPDLFGRRQRSLRRYASRLVSAALPGVLVLSIAACESPPIRSIRGARHYAEGSEALERGESTLAILELERAARFVPEASEIQNHLGLAYWADGQIERARFVFEHAVELDCDNLAAQRNLERLDATWGEEAEEDGERVQHGG